MGHRRIDDLTHDELAVLVREYLLGGHLIDRAGMPVVMTSLSITEQEYFPDLNPKRATVAVQLQVLEGFNPPYLYSHGWRTALAAMNLGNIGDFLNVL